jgi:general secretion pathway protein E
LIDMGLEPFLVASALRSALAQRLVRCLCRRCAAPGPTPPDTVIEELRAARLEYPVAPARWRIAVGCPDCNGTGYKGRLGIYEMVPLTELLQQAILRRAPTYEATEIARHAGFRSLRQDGLIKAASGITSLEEVVRVTGLAVEQ